MIQISCQIFLKHHNTLCMLKNKIKNLHFLQERCIKTKKGQISQCKLEINQLIKQQSWIINHIFKIIQHLKWLKMNRAALWNWIKRNKWIEHNIFHLNVCQLNPENHQVLSILIWFQGKRIIKNSNSSHYYHHKFLK